MKNNWGTGIVIAFICFIIFIMYFIIRMSTEEGLSHEMVSEQYYQKELRYQEDINNEENANQLSENITLKKEYSSLWVYFPKNIYSQITGNIAMYRPSDKKMDFTIPISSVEQAIEVLNQNHPKGRWNIRIDWSDGDQDYLFKRQIIF